MHNVMGMAQQGSGHTNQNQGSVLRQACVSVGPNAHGSVHGKRQQGGAGERCGRYKVNKKGNGSKVWQNRTGRQESVQERWKNRPGGIRYVALGVGMAVG